MLRRSLWGLIVPGIAIILVLVARAAVDETFGAGYAELHRWPSSAALMVAGLLVTILGGTLLRDLGEESQEGGARFLALPIALWGAVLFLGGLLYLIL